MADLLLQQLLNWVVLGSIYALIAVGFSLLFGVLNIIHFAHADVSFVAPFVALAGVQILASSLPVGAGPWLLLLCLVVSLLLTGVLGVVLEILVIRRFRNAPAMMALVATVALGIVLRELIRHLYPNGSNPHPFPRFVGGEIAIGGVTVSLFGVVAVICAVLAVAALFLLLNHTRLGLHIRAVSQDRDTARLMAISPARVFRATFFVTSAIGAVGGIFFAGYANIIRFDFSVDVGLIGFSAAVVGGLGSMIGAIVGSLLIAGLDIFVQAAVPNGASYRLVFVFLLVIAILVFKPSGLFGRTIVEKV